MRLLPISLVFIAWLIAGAMDWFWLGGWITTALIVLTVLLGVGIWDMLQSGQSLRRNYPIIGHLRYLFENVRPQIRQYFVESDTDGKPFDREQRSLVYARAKNEPDVMPFGTERDVKLVGFEWVNHSVAPVNIPPEHLRCMVGGKQCAKPYSASLFNISAMSFGSLSANAILALNKGAKLGGFAHDTGEGGLSPYHLRHGGDVIWEIGTGYFGCRMPDGAFDPQKFRERALHESVKMVEIKLSQGAKPGHGGVLPAAKISREISETRGVPMGHDCLSPPAHSAFSTPVGLLEFVAQLRDLSGGKPTGFKLCVGHRWEFLAICKAMMSTGIQPDFIVIDGKEGGTGAAPVEFSDRMGTPLRDGLRFVHNALVGCNLRDGIRLGASGKIISGFDIAVATALGADWCNAARGFMFALGCLQSQACHTNRCPVGIATQDPGRQRGLVVEDKAQRVANFHRHTLAAFADIVAAVGLIDPKQLRAQHFMRRISPGEVATMDRAYEQLVPGDLIDGVLPETWSMDWACASSESFRPMLAN